MRTNTSLTRFKRTIVNHEEVWTRVVIPAAFWMKKSKYSVTENGLIRADNTTLFIPFSEADEAPAIGDLIVKGKVEQEITDRFSVKDLKEAYPDSMSVRAVDPKDFGSEHMRHWQVEGS